MSGKSKKISAVCLMTAGLLVSHFAFATNHGGTTPAPQPVNQIPLDKQIAKGDWEKANTSQAECSKLAEKIRFITQKDPIKYTAVYYNVTERPVFVEGLPQSEVDKMYNNYVIKCKLHQYTLNASGNRVNAKTQSVDDEALQNLAYQYVLKTNTRTANHLPPTFFSNRGQAATGQNIDQPVARGNGSFVVDFIASLLAYIVDILNVALATLSALAGKIFSITLDYASKTSAPPIVTQGWVIMRDIMNLAFILAIIGISLATILRIENYSYKKLLGRLILMALLINFSKVIADSIIAVVNTLITTLASGANWSVLFENSLGYINPDKVWENTSGGGAYALAGSLVRLVLSIGMTAAFLAVAALLVIRMVSLWFLVIVSPVAYALRAFPSAQAQGYAKQWWSTFIKYLIWAPASVFFLRLTVMFVEQQQSNNVTGADNAFGFLLILALMWGSVLAAKQSGMIGANTVMGLAEKSTKWGSAAAAKYALRGTALKHAGAGVGAAAGGFGLARKFGFDSYADATKKFGKKLAKPGELMEKGTAYIEGAPSMVTEPLARSERVRQKAVADASHDAQLRLGTYGNFGDKDSAASLSSGDIYNLAKRGALDNEQASNLLEHNPKANEAMLLAMHDGLLGSNLSHDNRKNMYEQVFKSHFLSHGGKNDQFDLARQYYYDENSLQVAPQVMVDSINGPAHAQNISNGIKKRKAYIDPASLRIVKAQTNRQARQALAGPALAGAAAGAVVGAAAAGGRQRRQAGFAPNQPQNPPQQPPAGPNVVPPPNVPPPPGGRRGRQANQPNPNTPPPIGRGTGNFRQAPGFAPPNQTNPNQNSPQQPPAGPNVVPPPNVPPPPGGQGPATPPPPQNSSQSGQPSGNDAAAVALTAAAVAQAKAAKATEKSAQATIQAAKSSADALKNAAEVQKESARQSAGSIRNAAEESRVDLAGLESEIAASNVGSDRLSSSIDANTKEIKKENSSSLTDSRPDLSSADRSGNLDNNPKA